jgi:MFS transporter, PPP family, 3-phenylpropionic acid transporter
MAWPLPPLAFRLAGFYFAHFSYVALLVAYFPLYLAARGLRAGEIALVLALAQAARIFAPTAWGVLADRTGARRGIVMFGCAAIAASFAAMPYADGPGQIAALVVAMSVLSAGVLPIVEAITLGALRRAGEYGPIRLWGSVGFIALVLAGGAWLDRQPVSTLPAALSAFAMLSFAVAWALPRGRRQEPGIEGGLRRRFVLDRNVRAVLGAGFCMAAAHGALYAFYSLHLERAGYSAKLIGVLWMLGVLAEIGVFLALPGLFRRYALSAILLASFLCAAVRFAAIGWAVQWLAVLVLAQLLHAATFGAFHAASVAAVQKVFPEGAQARGQALYSSLSYGAGGAAGFVLAGWAWEAGGPALAFSLSAALGLAGAALACDLKRAGL